MYKIMASPAKIIPEDPEKKSMGVSNSKENRARVSDLCKDLVFNEEVIDSETQGGEIALNRVSDDLKSEEIRVSNPNSPSQNVRVNAFDDGVVANGFSEENNKENNNEIDSTGGNEKGDGEYNFRVGDFVWGKIKTHMWWPGRVSGFANQDEGRVSVAFFGHVSFSSCSSSELIPFADKFSEISKVSDSKSFVNAVNQAVDELSMLLELNMSCKCVRRAVENQVVMIPEVDSHHLAIPKYEPGELIGKLKELAMKGDFFLEGALEIAVLKSQLSLFYYFKGGYALPVYCEPCRIEGLEDEDEKDTDGVYKNDLRVPMQGPLEDDWLSTPSDSRVSCKRKEKSVAELIMPDENESIELENRKRKRKVNDNYYYVEPLLGKRKEFQVADDEDVGMVSTPRERKKSKYLSPPYTNLTSRIGDNSSFKTESKVKQDNKKLSDVDCEVDELLSEIKFAAVDPFYLSEKGSLDTVRGFIVALKSTAYLHGSNYKTYRKCKSSRCRESHLNKVLPPIKQDNVEQDASCSADDLISDAGLISQKVKLMTAILEDYHSRFGDEDKLNLKDDLKLLIEKVERVSEKVRVMAENISS